MKLALSERNIELSDLNNEANVVTEGITTGTVLELSLSVVVQSSAVLYSDVFVLKYR